MQNCFKDWSQSTFKTNPTKWSIRPIHVSLGSYPVFVIRTLRFVVWADAYMLNNYLLGSWIIMLVLSCIGSSISSWADPEGRGRSLDHSPLPWKITGCYRFLRNTGTDPTQEANGPLGSNCFSRKICLALCEICWSITKNTLLGHHPSDEIFWVRPWSLYDLVIMRDCVDY